MSYDQPVVRRKRAVFQPHYSILLYRTKAPYWREASHHFIGDGD
jgi:hypothetical protein